MVRKLGTPEDLITEIGWRSLQARLLSEEQKDSEAHTMATQAVELSDHTDSPVYQGDTRVDLAVVLRNANETKEARLCAEEALERYLRKGYLVAANVARAMLASS